MTTTVATSINDFSTLWGAQVWKATWQGGVALLLVVLCIHAVRSISGQLRCWMWRLAFLKIVIAGLWIQPVELRWLPPVITKDGAATNPENAPFADQIITKESPELRSAPTAPLVFPHIVAIRHLAFELSGLSWLMILWGAGVVLFLARLCRQWIQAGMTISDLVSVTDQEVQVCLVECCRQMRIGRWPELRVSNADGSPFLVGLFKPVIGLPPIVLQSGNVEMLTASLIHELAHLKRRDLWWNVLPALVEPFFFFHPLVWLARREWILAQEIAADELAVSVSRMGVARYAHSLIELVTRFPGSTNHPHLVVTVSAAYSQLRRRIIAMRTLQKFKTNRRVATGIAMLTVGVFGILPWTLRARRAIAQAETVISAEDKQALTNSVPKPGTIPVDQREAVTLHQFDRDYAPAKDEAIRRIPPPFPASRMAYYQIEHAKQAEHMPDGPESMVFHWKQGQKQLSRMSFDDPQKGATLRELLPSVCRFELLRGDELLLGRRVPGDFSIRADAPREALVADLQRILAAAWETPVALKLEQSEQDVYVARGRFKLNEAAKQRGVVLIEGALIGTANSVKEATEESSRKLRGRLDGFLDWLAKSIGAPIVNEVEEVPDDRISFHSILGGEINKVSPEPVLKSVGMQTGLTFTKEKRKISTLTVQKAG